MQGYRSNRLAASLIAGMAITVVALQGPSAVQAAGPPGPGPSKVDIYCKGHNWLFYGQPIAPQFGAVIPFRNQGECVSFVVRGGTPVPRYFEAG